MKKVFYLFVGVNGAGKSTLYNSESLNNDIKNTIRINTDEDNKILFKTKDVSWAKEAIEIIENNIKNK